MLTYDVVERASLYRAVETGLWERFREIVILKIRRRWMTVDFAAVFDSNIRFLSVVAVTARPRRLCFCRRRDSVLDVLIVMN